MIRSFLATLALVLGVLWGASPAMAGPARPDPRQMSGIPRPDPQIPVGEITVRVLLGGFDAPALDGTVELELRSADGRLSALRSEEIGNQGRVHFRELEPFMGGQAVARVVLDGETIRSRQIDVLPQSGTAVMLVKGAAKGNSPAQEVSLPGIVFDFAKTPAGTLMVGVFDLKTRKGLEGTEVELLVTTPDGEKSTRTTKTAAAGQTTFEGLAELPAGSILQIQAQIDEGEPHRSQRFPVDASKGQAVVLARGGMSRAGGNPHEAGGTPQGGPPQGGPHAQGRQKIPPPQIARDLPIGTLQVMVIDGANEPVADQTINIVKKDFSGTETRTEVRTDAEGLATASDLALAINDGLYYVGVPYDGAPYTSAFFGMDKRGGVRVAMRVFEVTDDPSVAKSAIQWEVIEGEQDHAQVVQVYEVLINGDKAFWPGPGMQVVGIEGAKSMVVMRGSEDWLEHEEKAPFATLSHPIIPGEVAALSLGYVVEHDGSIDFDWVPPFELMESAIVLSDEHVLDAKGAKVSERELPGQRGLDYVRVPYELGQKGKGTVQFRVTGLRRTEQLFKRIGMGGGIVLGLVLFLGVTMRPRQDTRARLERRRDELLVALSNPRTANQRERAIAALDRVYRQLDALGQDGVPARAKPETSTKSETKSKSTKG